MTLEEELREGGEYGDGCKCLQCMAADRIRELEAALDECCSTWRITQWAEHTAMYHAQRGLTAETSAQRSGDAK